MILDLFGVGPSAGFFTFIWFRSDPNLPIGPGISAVDLYFTVFHKLKFVFETDLLMMGFFSK